MLTKGPLLAALILLVAVIVIGSGLLSVILFARARDLKEPPKAREIEEPNEGTATSTGKLLEPHLQPTFGVTERTTDLLTVEKPRKSTGDI
jgi:FlaG/FlaF family flagellin (archaellin)